MTTSLRTTPVLLAAALLLAGCGSSTEGSTTATDPAAAPETLENPCPATLPPDQGGAAPGEVPSFSEAGTGWACEYGGPGAPETWKLTGEPVELEDEQLQDAQDGLAELTPADPAARMCTMDLGPRYLLVLSTDDGVERVSIDDFGCHDVRVVGEPGVLAAPTRLVDLVRTAAGGDQAG